MNKTLRYIGISYEKASVEQREKYHIPEEDKSKLIELIRKTYSDIAGLFLLATCNRTEIFFESVTTSADELRNFLIFLEGIEITEASKQLFDYSNNTQETILHLLEVSSGLRSSVLGDAEIIHQIKLAYQFSIIHNLQGSLLERAMQAVFKNHKRISNETHFRDGTTSIAYKTLKVISDTYKSSAKTKKILFIGAGDIVKQLFKYNSKFNFENIYISNRTEEKAITLSQKNQCNFYSWKSVLKNDFNEFDVIISAVSNRHHLVKRIPQTHKKILLVDLAIPENIDKALASIDTVNLFNLETISAELEETIDRRLAAIEKVNKILAEELLEYNKWLEKAPLRAFLAKCKIVVTQKVNQQLGSETEDYQINKIVTDRIMRKINKQHGKLQTDQELDLIIKEQLSLLEACV